MCSPRGILTSTFTTRETHQKPGIEAELANDSVRGYPVKSSSPRNLAYLGL